MQDYDHFLQDTQAQGKPYIAWAWEGPSGCGYGRLWLSYQSAYSGRARRPNKTTVNQALKQLQDLRAHGYAVRCNISAVMEE